MTPIRELKGLSQPKVGSRAQGAGW